MNSSDSPNSTSAMVHRAVLYSPPSIAPPMSEAMAVVRLVVGERIESGNCAPGR